MAGGGLYNKHSQPQHVAGGDGVPLLIRASEAIPLDGEGGVVTADYGSSQGRNSLVPADRSTSGFSRPRTSQSDGARSPFTG
jgi:hypothetical protein